VKLNEDDIHDKPTGEDNNFWINRNYGEAADDDDDFDIDEMRDSFRTGGGGRDLFTVSPPPMYYNRQPTDPLPYVKPHIHLASAPPPLPTTAKPHVYPEHQQQQRGPGVRRSSSLLERIRAAGNAPVVEGGLWSYGRLPVDGRPLPAPPVQPDKVK
jgi:hypothetical protein